MAPRIFLAVLALCAALVLIISDRGWSAASTPRIAEIDVLTDGPETAQVRAYTEYGSGSMPWPPGAAPPAAGDESPIKVGWSYREFSLMRMPFWASRELGLVTYLETSHGLQFAILGPGQVALLEKITGKSYAGYSFPIYRHLWGWLFVLGLVVWFLLNRRAAAKWREESGII